MGVDPKKLERLKKVCKAVNDSFKESPNLTYIGNNERVELERFSSGCIQLDEALGGGWPVGRICEIFGPESGGKTTLCYHAMAEFQKKYPDELVAWIDSEHSFDADYAEKLGVEVEVVLVQQPESGEQAFNVIRHCLQNGVKFIVVDSVAALTPAVELEKDIGDRTVGEQARLMSSGLRQLAGTVSKSNSFIIFTNQIREKIGTMSYGDNSTTPGGRALKFYSSIRVDVRSIGKEKDGEEVVSSKVKAQIKKNKTFPPFRTANFTITFGIGVDSIAGLFDAAVDAKVIDKSGSWFNLGDVRLGQGKSTVLEMLRDASNGLREKVEKALSQKGTKKKDSEDEDDEKEEPTEVKDTDAVVVDESEAEETNEEANDKQVVTEDGQTEYDPPKKRRGRPPKNKDGNGTKEEVSVEDV